MIIKLLESSTIPYCFLFSSSSERGSNERCQPLITILVHNLSYVPRRFVRPFTCLARSFEANIIPCDVFGSMFRYEGRIHPENRNNCVNLHAFAKLQSLSLFLSLCLIQKSFARSSILFIIQGKIKFWSEFSTILRTKRRIKNYDDDRNGIIWLNIELRYSFHAKSGNITGYNFLSVLKWKVPVLDFMKRRIISDRWKTDCIGDMVNCIQSW